MGATQALHGDQVYLVLEQRQHQELRFRSAMITSTAAHTGVTLAILLAPLFIPKPQIFELTPVNFIELQAPAPEPPPAPVEEEPAAEEAEPDPEPEELEPPPPEDVPEDLEAQRIAEEEAAARRREEERRQREEDEERARLAEEARRRREAEEQRLREEEEEDARRRQTQQAKRREVEPQQPQEITQQAERGEVGMQVGVDVSAQDFNYLQFWVTRVLTNINTNWDQPTRPQGSREIVAVIHFRVDRNGRLIVGPEVRSGSGDRRYDDAALRAVQGGQPFPPLPQAYRGSTLAINLRFRQ
jgi:colicin import membrane protein